jgi:L-alanine-DL-glutamate epimerase-like enolase superfamily enzyme
MTRIASVATHVISVPRSQPVWTAHEESKAWNVILTEVRTDDGLVGYGEAAGLPVYRLLGGEDRPIFTYATGGYYRPDASDADYGRELAQFIELGYRAVKLKTGAGTIAAAAVS